MLFSSKKADDPNREGQDLCETSEQQQKQRAAIPQIEVVNEIQIIVNKKNDQLSLKSAPNDSKDIKKCLSVRSSKTDLTYVTTPTTDTTDKHVTIKSGRRASRVKDKGDSICACGKILKRVKGLLEKKEKGGAGEWNKTMIMIDRRMHN